MYYKYTGSGQQLQVFRADGGYVSIPAEDLSAEEAAELGAPEGELLGCGLYEAVEGDKPAPVPEVAPTREQQLQGLRMQAAVLALQIATLEAEESAGDAGDGEQAADAGSQETASDSADSAAEEAAPVAKRRARGGAE